MAFDPIYASVKETIASIQHLEASPVELVERLIDRIEEVNPSGHFFISINADGARVAARSVEVAIKSGSNRQALAGVPFACKDVFWTRELPTTGGSRVLENWVADQDAAVLERLAESGAILLGKTNLHEFGYGATGINPHFGTAVNPWSPDRIAGGSSTGSAASVACGLVPFALGTDAGGSVRGPAALCGVVGLKPTYGRISGFGSIPYSWSIDHVGIFSRSVEDVAVVLEVLAGFDSRDPVSVAAPVPRYSEALGGDIRDLRIGVPRRFFYDHVDPEILAATFDALRCAEGLGAKLVDVETPDLDATRTVSLTIQMPEVLSYHSRFLATKRELYGEDLKSGFAVGQFILAEHYVRAKRIVTQYRQDLSAIFEDVDLLMTPTCPVVAPRLDQVTVTTEGKEEALGDAHSRFTNFFNLTGNPAISIPSGLHSTGLPMGVQVIARPFEEETLLRAGDAIQRAIDLPALRPMNT
ncbi:MAG: amidase [Gammaproteobacteria bacterium]|jgi:aspartyl-tRNA(Asn)/glutamyl-tRNA(Gln) amidotransferase subunit A|nr:amidase [Gammaproteobacteria bacterium]